MKKSEVGTNQIKSWIVCLVAAIFFMDEFMRINMFNALRGDLMTAFKISAGQYGQLSAYYFYGNVLMLFPAGIMLDRFSIRKLLTFVTLLCAGASFLLGYSHSLLWATVARLIIGIGGGIHILIGT